jgi:TatD DNase family protein
MSVVAEDRVGSVVRWTDDHCHLPEDVAAAAEIVAGAAAAGVERLVTVGTDLASSRTAIGHAGRFAGVFATAGVHPHDASGGCEGIAELLGAPGVVAVGEAGLDYHYDHSPRAVQREVFAAQIALAATRDLPLVIHTREAWDDTFDVLAASARPPALIFHCFTGGADEARRCLDLGGHLSFSGIVTFPNADDVRDAVRVCPLDRLLVETDSPYLSPVPHRGRPNVPARVAVVGEGVAAVRGAALETIAEATWATAQAVYRLPA